MPSYLTRHHLHHAHQSVNRVLRDMEQHKSITHRTIGAGIGILEVNAGAFAAGVAGGRWGDVGYQGVPLDAASGLALHAIALATGGEYAAHAHNFANGLLAAWTMRAGVTVGMQWRQKIGLSPVAMSLPGAPATSGLRSMSTGATRGPLTQVELAAMAQAMPRRRAA